MNLSKKLGSIPFLITIFIILLAFSVWYWWSCMIPSQSVEVAVPEQVEQAATSTDEMAGWKTYKNEEYGFEFKYPLFYEVSFESANLISFQNSAECVRLETQGGGKEISRGCRNLSVSFANEIHMDSSGEEGGVLKVDGIPTYVTRRIDPDYFEFVASIPANSQREDQFYTVRMIGTAEQAVVGQKEFDHLLSTFKFIDYETSDWKTYRNEEYGFEFQYPDVYENDFVNEIKKIFESASNSPKSYELFKDYKAYFIARTKYETYPDLIIGIKPLKDYKYDNQSGGKITFDLQNDNCIYTEKLSEEIQQWSTTTQSKLISDAHACPIASGEGREGVRGYAVPFERRDLVIEVMVGYAYPNKFDFEKLLSTFKFTN